MILTCLFIFLTCNQLFLPVITFFLPVFIWPFFSHVFISIFYQWVWFLFAVFTRFCSYVFFLFPRVNLFRTSLKGWYTWFYRIRYAGTEFLKLWESRCLLADTSTQPYDSLSLPLVCVAFPTLISLRYPLLFIHFPSHPSLILHFSSSLFILFLILVLFLFSVFLFYLSFFLFFSFCSILFPVSSNQLLILPCNRIPPSILSPLSLTSLSPLVRYSWFQYDHEYQRYQWGQVQRLPLLRLPQRYLYQLLSLSPQNQRLPQRGE